ncbi:MAG: hypothetical protein PHY28_08570 [Dehalococcoidales bacterium]|nr:hypothetical protein [Dehalococcoidales bacterium]
MDIDDAKIKEAVERTEILRVPSQNLTTFGTTNIYYYLVTEPAYAELAPNTVETIVREGRVIAEKPRIVTPYYLSSIEGFSDNARRYFDHLIKKYGRNVPGLLYAYRNEPKEMNIVSDNMLAVVAKLNEGIDKRGDPLTTIIKGMDEMWDIALIKFIFEMTQRSVGDNIRQMGARGLLTMDDKGIPADARARIEGLFLQVAHGDVDPQVLKDEIDRWNIFAEYEDRFLSLFRK